MPNNEYFDITDEQLDSFDFKDKVIIVTGKEVFRAYSV